MDTGSRKAVLAAMSANAGIAVAKFGGFAVTGAASMLAEAVHSVADTANQGLLLWGGAAARKRPDNEYAFGYGRERYFWSFVVALVIFSLGGLFAIYEGIEKLHDPHELSNAEWAIGILSLSIVLEGLSFRTAIRASEVHRGEQTWWSFIRNTKNPELPVVLLEDLGALTGLVLALLGIGAATLTGDPRFDAMGSIAIGVLLVAIGIVLAVEMKALLIGESVNEDDEQHIRGAITGSPHVTRLINMRTQHLSPDEILLGAKVEFDGHLSLRQLAIAIDEVEHNVRMRVPEVKYIYVEPDFFVHRNDADESG